VFHWIKQTKRVFKISSSIMRVILFPIILLIQAYTCFGNKSDNVKNRIDLIIYIYYYRFFLLLFQMSSDKIALVTGYTGESGKALVKELIKNDQFKKIILVGRRKVDFTENEYKEKTVLIEKEKNKREFSKEIYLGTT
jgi:hypothetical protein